jgi:hypothetical protein
MLDPLDLKFTPGKRILHTVSAKRYKNNIDYKKYTMEFFLCGFFSFAFIFFLRGRSSNDELATKFNKGIADAVSSNFAHFGTQKDPSLALEKITFNDYHFYASGR